jgi:hypothetical protein
VLGEVFVGNLAGALECPCAYNATTANPDEDMDDLEWVVECIVSNPAMWVDCEEMPGSDYDG